MERTPADDLAHLNAHPQYWMNKALALHASAGAVWICRNQRGSEYFRKEPGLNLEFEIPGESWQVYRMLCGMSLELCYKASLIAKRSEIRKTHDLVALAEEVLFTVSSRERGLLALLSECVIWEGRYPAPKDSRSLEYFAFLHFEILFEKVWDGNNIILKPKEPDPLDWEGYSALWNAAVAAYEWHKS